MRTQCPHCQRMFRVADKHEGKKAKCTLCGRYFIVARIEARTGNREPVSNEQHAKTLGLSNHYDVGVAKTSALLKSDANSQQSITRDPAKNAQLERQDSEVDVEAAMDRDATHLRQVINAVCILCLATGIFILVVPSMDLIFGVLYLWRTITWSILGVLMVFGSLLITRFSFGIACNESKRRRGLFFLLVISLLSVCLLFVVFANRSLGYCLGFLLLAMILLYLAKTVDTGIRAHMLGVAFLYVCLALISFQPLRVMNTAAKVVNRRHTFAVAHGKYKKLVSSLPNTYTQSIISPNDVAFEALSKAVVFVGKEKGNGFVQSPYFCEAYIGWDLLARGPEDVRYLAVSDMFSVDGSPFGLMGKEINATTHLWIYKWPEETLVMSRDIQFKFDSSYVWAKVSFLETLTRHIDLLFTRLPFYAKEERSFLRLQSDSGRYMEGHLGNKALYRSYAQALRKALIE